jgi:predicted ATPase
MSCFKKLNEIIDVENFKLKEISKTINLSSTTHSEADKKASLWENAASLSAIPSRYRNASIDNCDLLPIGIVELGKRWINAFQKPCLYLHGNTGSGKTYFATALYRALVEKKIPWMIFVKSYDLDDELLQAIEDRHEKTKLMKYSEASILFIDDLGVERPSDRVIRQYFSIIDKRVGEGLVTVLTSNSSKKNLPFGDRMISRLEYFYDIEFPKKDLRKNLDLPSL